MFHLWKKCSHSSRHIKFFFSRLNTWKNTFFTPHHMKWKVIPVKKCFHLVRHLKKMFFHLAQHMKTSFFSLTLTHKVKSFTHKKIKCFHSAQHMKKNVSPWKKLNLPRQFVFLKKKCFSHEKHFFSLCSTHENKGFTAVQKMVFTYEGIDLT